MAFLLTEHAQLRQAHRRELNDAERDGQRGARDAFSAGILEGLDQRNRG